MFQFAKWYLQLMHTTITILGIYRPPAGSPVEFFIEITNWITDVVVQDTNLLVVRDFNLHINNESDENVANIKESMVALGLVQHVTRPTHKSGNILELIFMEDFSEINIHSYMINCKTSLRCQEICHRDINYHDLANIDLELMAEDIKPDITDRDTLDIQVGKLDNT